MEEALKKAVQKLGFDPTKGGFADVAVQQALREVAEERGKLKTEEVKKKITELISLMEEAKKVEGVYNSAKKKIDKGIGKLLAQLEGRPDPDGEKNEEKAE